MIREGGACLFMINVEEHLILIKKHFALLTCVKIVIGGQYNS